MSYYVAFSHELCAHVYVILLFSLYARISQRKIQQTGKTMEFRMKLLAFGYDNKMIAVILADKYQVN